jgi:hypothetical protein
MMRSFGMHRRLAGVLAVAALVPAFTAWTHAANPAAQVLGCASAPVASGQAAGVGGQRGVDMPPVPGRLWAIAARSPTSAVALGTTIQSRAGVPLVARWNGTAWKTLNNPMLPPASDLFGVAMFRGGAWAVGQQDESGDGDPLVGQPLLVRLTGSAVRQVPVPKAPDGSELDAVAATSATDAWRSAQSGVTLS